MQIEHILEPATLRETVTISRGNLRTLITVPHDGKRTYGLPFNPNIPNNRKPQDVGTSRLAAEILKSCWQLSDHKLTPSLVHLKIQRSHRNSQVQNHFELQVGQELRTIKGGLHLDLHAFHRRPGHRDRDIHVGTASRQSILGSPTDMHFTKFMQAAGYDVAHPFENPHNPFPANGHQLQTDFQPLVALFKDHPVRSMQIEIAHYLLNLNQWREGRRLARNLAAFILLDSGHLPRYDLLE